MRQATVRRQSAHHDDISTPKRSQAAEHAQCHLQGGKDAGKQSHLCFMIFNFLSNACRIPQLIPSEILSPDVVAAVVWALNGASRAQPFFFSFSLMNWDETSR